MFATELMSHEIIAQFSWQEVVEYPDFVIDALGGKTRRAYLAKFNWPISRPDQYSFLDVFKPGINEEIYEWLDVLESVLHAHDRFTMIELGCGYGRWLVYAALALQQRGALQPRLIGVEAEPRHFRWAHTHFHDNHLPPAHWQLIPAAVGPHDGTAKFYVGSSDCWYGQCIAPEYEKQTNLLERGLRFLFGHQSRPMDTIARVQMISLDSILKTCPTVDLIDMDIQGAEYSVLAAAANRLDRQVYKVHVATHSREIEADLRTLFTSLQWMNVNDYPGGQVNETRFGKSYCEEGMQTWLNVKLRSSDHH